MSVARLSTAFFVTSLCALVTVAACGDSSVGSTFDAGDEDGGSSGSSGQLPTDDAGSGEIDGPSGPATGTLEAIVRDFKAYDANDPSTNPDFENVPPEEDRPLGAPAPYFGPWTEASDKYFPDADYPLDIVLPDLGADDIPVYNAAASFKGMNGRTATTHSKAAFDQWYRDVPGVNVTRKVVIRLAKNERGVYSYDSAVEGVPLSAEDPKKQFFPIDDGTAQSTTADGFGNQGNPHNYHFTVELRTKFKYRGTETFKFSGDDDVFVFINKKLVINIGGIHSVLAKEVKLPEIADEIGLVVGQEYALDFFQAERHVVESNLRIETTLELEPSLIK